MESKKWPILAQCIIAWGLIVTGTRNIVLGISKDDWIYLGIGFVAFVIFWNVYRRKQWALVGLNLLLSFNILSVGSFMFMKRINFIEGIVPIIVCSVTLYYFNSKTIKALFDLKE